jgi:PAS domain S-box-containing protein
MSRDTTVRNRAERATSLLAAIVDSSDDAIISKNLDGVITSWNKAAERLFGYTPEEAIGQHITLIIPLDRRDEEAGILARLRRGERVDHFETVRIRKDRTLLDISLTISPVRDAAGRVVGASKVARDITERRQVEQALAERALLLDLSNDAILVRDGADRITYWNKSASELYGYSREEALGCATHELLHTEFPEPLDRITEQLQRDGRWTGELIHRHKDGGEIVVMSRWALNRDDRGNWKCVLETSNDITQQKQNEKALRESENRLRVLTDTLETQVRIRTEQLVQRNAEVLKQSEQLRELSHQLMQLQDEERRHIARELHDSAGQLLTVLAMNLSTLVRKTQEIAPEIAESAEEARELVRQLTSEIRTTSYLLHPPLLDEEGLEAAISWYVRGLTERSGIDITFNISEGFGRLPREMELAVFRMVQECLTNIHRHSGSKLALIEIYRTPQQVVLEVRDEGKGIPPEKLAEIQSRGTGIGIRGMRERVCQFKGDMAIESSGLGTLFRVTIPAPAREEVAVEETKIQTA